MRLRKVFIAIVLCSAAKIFSQGYPVFDNLGLLAAIDRFYQGYDQIMNTLTMIEQNYQQIQQAYERAKSWNFESLDFNDGNIMKNLDIRDEIRDAGTQINRQMNNVRKIKETFTAKNITMNGHSYSLKDLAGLGDADRSLKDLASDTAYMTKDTLRESALKFAQGVTEEEAKNIYAKYGISPKNFAMVEPISKMMQKAMLAVTAPAQDMLEGLYNENVKEEIELENSIAKKLLEGSGDDLTVAQATQALGLLSKLSLDQMRELNRSIQSSTAYTAWYNRYEAALQEAKENSRKEWAKMMENDSNFMQEIF